MSFQWTTERLTLLRDLWEQDFTGGQIARRLFDATNDPISRNAVLGRAWRLGLKKPKKELAPKTEKPVVQDRAPITVAPSSKRRIAIMNFGAEATRASYVKITLPVIAALAKPANPVNVLDLGSGLCRWPLWHADDLPPSQKMFCGASAGTRSYCPRHSQMAYSGVGRRS